MAINISDSKSKGIITWFPCIYENLTGQFIMYAVAYPEVGRTTLEDSREVIKVVKVVIFL